MERKLILLGLVGLLVLSLGLSGCDNKKGQLTGEIYDGEDGDLITKEVIVSLDQDTRRVEEGRYTFTDLKPGEKTLVVQATDYEDYNATVNILAGEVTTHNVTLEKLPQLSPLSFSPAGGTYFEIQNVTIGSDNDDVKIYYTNDGSEPDDESTLFEDEIVVDKTTTIKAIAYKDNWLPSEAAEAVYTLQVTKPNFSHAGGLYHEPLSIEIVCDSQDAQIYYTTNGGDPGDQDILYQGPIAVERTTTIKAIACKEGWDDSAVAEVTYNIPEFYQAILIGDDRVNLLKQDDELEDFDGLSWQWDEQEENGWLVMKGYDGPGIKADSALIQFLNIRLEGDSTIRGNTKEALFFNDGITIEGDSSAQLTLKSEYLRTVFAVPGCMLVKDIDLLIDLDHIHGSPNNVSRAVDGTITVSGVGKLEITAKRSCTPSANLYGINMGHLVLEDTASARVEVFRSAESTNAAYGIDVLRLRGTGVCVITVGNESGGGVAQAVKNQPIIPQGYEAVEGDWHQSHVRYEYQN